MRKIRILAARINGTGRKYLSIEDGLIDLDSIESVKYRDGSVVEDELRNFSEVTMKSGDVIIVCASVEEVYQMQFQPFIDESNK